MSRAKKSSRLQLLAGAATLGFAAPLCFVMTAAQPVMAQAEGEKLSEAVLVTKFYEAYKKASYREAVSASEKSPSKTPATTPAIPGELGRAARRGRDRVR